MAITSLRQSDITKRRSGSTLAARHKSQRAKGKNGLLQRQASWTVTQICSLREKKKERERERGYGF